MEQRLNPSRIPYRGAAAVAVPELPSTGYSRFVDSN